MRASTRGPSPVVFGVPLLAWGVALLAAVFLAAALPAAGQDAGFTPRFKPQLTTSRAAGEITVDGVLDDAGWRGAGVADGFSERSPGNNIAPLVSTEARITYDDDNLYVAFVCRDDPDAIRATLCQRDQFFSDDAVALYLDTFGEGQWAYQFFVNPYGIQKDQMWTLVHGQDRGFDMVWHAAARRTADGYTVEMAIPFASLRFPRRDVQAWQVDFRRVHPRESYREYAWAAHDRDDQCAPCQWGTVDGITGVEAGKGLEVLPSVIAYETKRINDELDPDSGLGRTKQKAEASLGVKYKATSDVTLEGTINPDFSQIEADADQIDVNTTIVQRFPERRPFFQEGNDLFRTYFNSFYTRMVANPEVAAKGTARWTKSSLAYMFARDEDSPYIVPTEERSYARSLGFSSVNVLRGLQSLGNNSHAGFMVTDRRYDGGGSGTILSGDFNLRLSSRYSWIGQYVWSDTREPEGVAIKANETFADGKYTVDLDGESYTGQAFITELRRAADHWNFVLDYNQVDQTYRTQTGYDPWNDQRNGFVWTTYNFNFDEGLVERVSPGIFVNGRWNWAGERKWLHINPQVSAQLRWAQTGVDLGYNSGQEVWGGVVFDDLWSVNLNINSQPNNRVGWSAFVQTGEGPALFSLARGDELGASAALSLKPWDSLVVEPTLDYLRSRDHATDELLFEQTIVRARVRWQVTKPLSLRLVVQHNNADNPPFRAEAVAGNFPDYHMAFGRKWEVDPLLTYQLNSFSVLYLGSTHDYRDFNAADPDAPGLYRQTARQYFMKLQYLFQV